MKTNPFRADAVQKVKGQTLYAADYTMPGMLYAKTLWTEQINAVIKNIDTYEAEKMPGVERVITAKDIKGTNLANIFLPYDRPVLIPIGGKACFAGDSLALVVADTEEHAAQAVKKIRVHYEPFEGPYTLEEAKNMGIEPYKCFAYKKGDIEQGFREADYVFEETFKFPMVEHAYLETECGFAYTDGTGVVNLVFGSQNLGRHHRMLSESLGISNARLRIISPHVGGGFGGKHSISVQNHLVLAAMVTGKPVKMVWSREESFFAGCKRHDLVCTSRLGVTNEGKIKAAHLKVESPGAPYDGYATATITDTIQYTLGCYSGEHMLGEMEIYHCAKNEFGAFRGFGATEGTHIFEVMMDIAARTLGIDPYEFRLKNVADKDEIENQYEGAPWMLTSADITAKEVLDKALEIAGTPPSPSPGKKSGRGIALGMGMYGVGDQRGSRGSSVDVKMFYDGTVNVRVGVPEIGSGVTGVAMNLVQELLGLSDEEVTISYGDSHTAPRHGSLGFSQATVNIGNAIIDACAKLKSQISKEAQRLLDTEASIEYHGGKLTYQNGANAMDFEEFLYETYLDGSNFCATGWFRGYSPRNRSGITYIAGVADVEVDEETGEVICRRLVNVHDLGRIIHYESARGQMVGGALMAHGIAMSEEFLLEKGRPVTPSFAEYLIPTSMDIPDENLVGFVEVPARIGPFGAKGIGEHGLYVTPPAISNAIYDAVGIRLTSFPFTPEHVLKKLEKIK